MKRQIKLFQKSSTASVCLHIHGPGMETLKQNSFTPQTALMPILAEFRKPNDDDDL